ncbi:PP2C family protein-serine/threonine phosphatase [Streptomyces sp. NPDC014779]|uniref:PP2C family protein-serine/threonine phosphatase n=1 Tax=Streptomyces sp. NPDC014779 TaxID=3364911 RepID=UPI003702624E
MNLSWERHRLPAVLAAPVDPYDPAGPYAPAGTAGSARPRRIAALLLPGVLMALLLALYGAGHLTGGQCLAWLTLVPGLAALLSSVRVTAAYAVLTLAAFVALHSTASGLALILVSGLGAVAVCCARLRAVRRAARTREVADTTWRTVLRPLPQGWGGLEHAAAYTTADVAARVGGDFYDIQPSAHGTRLVLGDVQGKGLDAVACAAALVGSFREAAAHERELAGVALRMDGRLRRHQEYVRALGGDETERFATAALLHFPPTGADAARAVDLVNCGHLTPLAVSAAGVRPLTGEPALPLGLLSLADSPPSATRFILAPGETLLLCSDGVTEARDAHGAFYPLHEDLAGALRSDPALAAPDALVRHVRTAAAAHAAGGLADDTTVLAVRADTRPAM